VLPTTNTEAHELYLRGLHIWRNFYGPGYERVRKYFEEAISLDPSFAPAYAGLSLYHAWAAANGIFPPEHWPLADDAVQKALSLDDTLPEGYNSLAAVEIYYKRNWSAAERAFRRGIEVNPNFADVAHHYGVCLTLMGRNEEALDHMNRAASLDPLFPGLNLHYGRAVFLMHDYDRAISHFAKMLELYPDNATAHEYFGDACEQKGNRHEAITQWTAAYALGGKTEYAQILEKVFAKQGFEAALRALAERQLEDLDRQRASGAYVAAAHYVFANVRRGNIDAAFEWLPKMVEEPNWFALQLPINPILDPLRGDPRFGKIKASLVLK
jgi:tetratricopeptide (TPR) repeat protein